MCACNGGYILACDSDSFIRIRCRDGGGDGSFLVVVVVVMMVLIFVRYLVLTM